MYCANEHCHKKYDYKHFQNHEKYKQQQQQQNRFPI